MRIRENVLSHVSISYNLLKCENYEKNILVISRVTGSNNRMTTTKNVANHITKHSECQEGRDSKTSKRKKEAKHCLYTGNE